MRLKTHALQYEDFKKIVWNEYWAARRTFPWRKTRDPYRITVSELMLQQTQAERVVSKYQAFITKFPTWHELSRAQLSDVLKEWAGLGYNRRAKFLHRLARAVVETHKGKLPKDYHQLIKLPGIGPATATAIRAFAFNLPGVYLETNVRSVYLHHFFLDKKNVSDKEIIKIIELTQDHGNPREWNWALLDYGVAIKKKYGNPNVRSRHYAKQSAFEGSHRQIRGGIIRLLANRKRVSASDISTQLGREISRVLPALAQLVQEGMVARRGSHYRLA